MKIIRLITLLGIAALFAPLSIHAQQNGSISGQVQDALGDVVAGATVTVTDASGKERTTTTGRTGEFSVTGLTPGRYKVTVFASNFALYDNTEVDVTAGRRTELSVLLVVETVEEVVDIDTGNEVSTDAANNLSATVLKQDEIDALPDDPDELEAALQALAGAGAGPDGGQIYIDGFTGGRMPPKEAIREIRINQNPFSAEYDRLGFGRIEILTRPGSDSFRGSVSVNLRDSRLDSRNPFAANKAPAQTRSFRGNISGPVQKGKSSFFFDMSYSDEDSSRIINAQLLDPSLNVYNYTEDVEVPSTRWSLSPRFDYQIGQNHTLQFRYNFSSRSAENQGVGDLTLLSRASDSKNVGHEFRFTETSILSPKTINETRFSLDFDRRDQEGDNSIPSISVGSAFSGGGAQIGLSFNRSNRWELQNYTTTSFGDASQHAVKFGVRLRGVSISDRSESGYGGSFSFTNIDQYRDAILGLAIPTSFSINTGSPEQSVSQTELGLFVTDDWRVNPALTLSFGLRYENQTNISDSLNFAPRFSFALAPATLMGKTPKTVIRGGVGVFYSRFGENQTLQAKRFNGVNQMSLSASIFEPDPVLQPIALQILQQPIFTLNGVTNVPTAAEVLALLPYSSTVRVVAPDLQAPYMYQWTAGVERQLPFNSSMSVFYIGSRTLHVLRARNINAPICPDQIDCDTAPRPFPDSGPITQFESSGINNQNRLMVTLRSSIARRFTVFGNYGYGFTKSDADGTGSFPAYSYDLTDEYGRSSGDIRHTFNLGGNISLPWDFSLRPMITANSGSPYNLIRGEDTNRDGINNERPTFGEVAARCTELGLTHSFCDVSGFDPNAIVPRNFADGPKFFSVNLGVSKNFGFGKRAEPSGRQGVPGGGGWGGVGGRGGRGPGGGGFGGFGGGGRSPYNLSISVNFNNLLNTVNYAAPVSNLASTRFGEYTRTQGGFGGFGGFGGGSSTNRSVSLQARFSW